MESSFLTLVELLFVFSIFIWAVLQLRPKSPYIFPLMRQVFPQLSADEIVSAQPMINPTGIVFYFDYDPLTDTNDTEFDAVVKKPGSYGTYNLREIESQNIPPPDWVLCLNCDWDGTYIDTVTADDETRCPECRRPGSLI